MLREFGLLAALLAAACGEAPGETSGAVDGAARGHPRQVAPTRRPRFAVDGTVLDLSGRPIALAWVRFTPRAGGVVVQTLTDLDGVFDERWTCDGTYDVDVLVPHPNAPYGPGVPAGRVRGGTRGVALRVPR